MTRLSFLLFLAAAGRTAAVSPADAEFFEKQVRPVLSEHCWSCHGPMKQTAGLRLDSRAAILKGGESGPAINEKEPAKSMLLAAIRREGPLHMPPKAKLPAPAVDALTAWVNRGAPWPEVATARESADWRKHWALLPVRDPTPPVHPEDVWSCSTIDRFVWEKLRDKGLPPSAEADKRVLIRRLTYDLTGLPPTPEEIDAFLADTSAEGYERLVSRLLNSPAYGEHWARMWLDVARYADTKGYVFFEESAYPWAYTYRDYVIEAFNKDLPYDRFLQEQIAADRLGGDRQTLRALGFLTVGGRFMNNTHDIIDDRIDVVTRGLMGLTVTCARCHDHKFDPVSTQDYYGLYGVFASCEEPTVYPLYEPPPKTEAYEAFAREMAERERRLRDFVQRKKDELAAGARRRAAEYLLAAHALRDKPAQEEFMLIADGNDLNPKMIVRWQAFLARTRRTKDPVFAAWHRFAELLETDFAVRAPEAAADLQNGGVNAVVARAFRAPPESMVDVAKRYAELLTETYARYFVAPSIAWERLITADPAEKQIRALLADPDYPPNVTVGDYGDLDLLPDRPSQAELQKLRKALEQWRANGPGAPPRAMALLDSLNPVTPRVFQRGNPYNLGPGVPRQFLECLSGPDRKAFADGSGRLELAKAVADPMNPLTARVFVNRVWQHFFGRGIVTTPGDFGLRGDPPSHPELLDYLASTFVADGWSVKHLVKRIVLSSAYRQRSDDRTDGAKADPDNTLLWRANRRRLGFEPMRDALLAAAGKLDRAVGGRSVQNFLAPSANRRTLYAHLDRLNVPGVYRTFDFPSPDATAAKRVQTTVPPQALFVMNHPFVAECARNLLRRPDVAAVADTDQKLDSVYVIIHGRHPTDRERAAAADFLAADPVNGWPRFAHALLMTNEFLIVD
jgi:Protein of unknown function (DUF1553)/Protein of unknown function (DUF1549)/Planctomycete cytochrome C